MRAPRAPLPPGHLPAAIGAAHLDAAALDRTLGLGLDRPFEITRKAPHVRFLPDVVGTSHKHLSFLLVGYGIRGALAKVTLLIRA